MPNYQQPGGTGTYQPPTFSGPKFSNRLSTYASGGANPLAVPQAEGDTRPYGDVGKMPVNLLDINQPAAAEPKIGETGGLFTGFFGAIGNTFGTPGREAGELLGHLIEAPLGVLGGAMGAVGGVGLHVRAPGAPVGEEINPAFADMSVIDPGGNVTLGSLVQSGLGMFGLLGRVVERAYAGSSFRNIEAVDPELQAQIDAGLITREQAADILVSKGLGFTDDLATNIGFSILLDPLTWLTLGVGGVAKGAAGVAKVASGLEKAGSLGKGERLTAAAARAALAAGDTPITRLGRLEALGLNTFGRASTLTPDSAFVRVANQVTRVTDPLRLFGGGDIGKRTADHVMAGATEGYIAAYKPGVVNEVHAGFEKVGKGLGAKLDRALAIATTNLTYRWIADEYTSDALRAAGDAEGAVVDFVRGQEGIGLNPNELVRVTLANKGVDRSIGRQIEMLAERTKPFFAQMSEKQIARSTIQKAARITGRSEIEVEKALGTITYDKAALIHSAFYADMGRELIDEVVPRIRNSHYVLPKDVIPERLTLIGERTFTTARRDALAKAVEIKDYATVRKMISTLEDFDFINEKAIDVTKNDDLLAVVDGWLKQNGHTALTEVRLRDALGAIRTDLPAPLRTWMQDADGFGYRLALTPKGDPEDLYRITRDASGRLLNARPWVDFVSQGSEFVRPNRLQQTRMQLFRQVRAERIVWTNRRTFVRNLVNNHGIAPGTAERMFRTIVYDASERGIAPRGLKPNEIMTAAKRAINDEAKRGGGMARLTERQLTRELLVAFKGDFSQVGVTQAFTGAAKVRLPGAAANYWGGLAEKVYPMVKFTFSPWFMLQEYIEPYVLNIMRGVKTPLRTNSRGFQEALATRNAINQFLVKDLGDDGALMEMAEYQRLLAGSASFVHDRLGKTVGNMTEGVWGQIAQRKMAAEALLTKRVFGQRLKETFTEIRGPQFWIDLERHYGTTDSGEIAMRWMAENHTLRDANGEKVEAIADLLNPLNVGKQTRILRGEGTGLRFHHLAEFLGYTDDHDGEVLVKALKDHHLATIRGTDVPAGAISRERFFKEGADAGLNLDFLKHAYDMATGPEVDEFWDGYKKAFTYRTVKGTAAKNTEAEMARALVQVRAATMGISEEQFIKSHFADVPFREKGTIAASPEVLLEARQGLTKSIQQAITPEHRALLDATPPPSVDSAVRSRVGAIMRRPAATGEAKAFVAPTVGGTADEVAPVVPRYAPGEAPLEPGMIRAYHYTGRNEDPAEALRSIRENGLLQGKATGETYGEPNQIWLSTAKPDNSHYYVEVHLRPEQITGSGGGNYFWFDTKYADDGTIVRTVKPEYKDEVAAWADTKNARGDNFAVSGSDIPPEQIVTYSEPWMHEYRSLAADGPQTAAEFEKEFGWALEGRWPTTPTGIAIRTRMTELSQVPTDPTYRVVKDLPQPVGDQNYFQHAAASRSDELRAMLDDPALPGADRKAITDALAKVDAIRNRPRWAFRDEQGREFFLGSVKPEDLVQMALDWMDEGEGLSAKAWYSDLRQHLNRLFGDSADDVLRAFAVSQASDSPVNGLAMVMRGLEDAFVNGLKVGERKVPGGTRRFVGARLRPGSTQQLNVENINRAMLGADINREFAAKLNDFLDSVVGNSTRRWIGRVEGVGPVAVDRHTARDVGLLDAKVIGRLTRLPTTKFANGVYTIMDSAENVVMRVKMVGKGADWHLVDEAGEYVDAAGARVTKPVSATEFTGAPNDWQYEVGSDIINKATAMFNERAVWNRVDWRPEEVQAVGWMRVQKTIGGQQESPMDMFRLNTQVVASEVSAERGSDWMRFFRAANTLEPWQQREVTRRVNAATLSKIRDMFGITTISHDWAGPARWIGGDRTFSAPAVLLSSPESGDDVADILALTNRQREVWNPKFVSESTVKAQAKGNPHAHHPVIDIPHPGGVPSDQMEEDLNKIADAMDAPGATMFPDVNGNLVLRIIDKTSEEFPESYFARTSEGLLDEADFNSKMAAAYKKAGLVWDSKGGHPFEPEIAYADVYIAGPKFPPGNQQRLRQLLGEDGEIAEAMKRGDTALSQTLNGEAEELIAAERRAWETHLDDTVANIRRRGRDVDEGAIRSLRDEATAEFEDALGAVQRAGDDGADGLRAAQRGEVLNEQRGTGSILGYTKRLDDNRRIIAGLKNADPVTGLHELTHVFAGDLDASARRLVMDARQTILAEQRGLREAQIASLRASIAPKKVNGVEVARPERTVKRVTNQITALEGELGSFTDDAVEWSARDEEWFVSEFQKWLKTGKAPNPKLEGVFDHFKNWIGRVWSAVKGQAATPGDEASPQMVALFEEMFSGRPKPSVSYDIDQHVLRMAAKQQLRMAQDEAFTTQYFKMGRSFAERSLNHPFVGLYPLSYMWGKVLPEMFRFLALRPFGMTAPMVGWNALNEVSDQVNLQKQTDPAFAQFLTDNKDLFMTMSSLFPALPNEIPVSAPLWMRRISEQGLENADLAAKGKPVKDVDLTKGLGDQVTYIFGPVQSAQRLFDAMESAGDTFRGALGMQHPDPVKEKARQKALRESGQVASDLVNTGLTTP